MAVEETYYHFQAVLTKKLLRAARVMVDYVINGTTSKGRDQNLSFSPTTIMTKRHSKRVPQRKFQPHARRLQ